MARFLTPPTISSSPALPRDAIAPLCASVESELPTDSMETALDKEQSEAS
jgi:hypothetical protein